MENRLAEWPYGKGSSGKQSLVRGSRAMPFARNQWYVAAHSEEVGEGLLARTICAAPIVLHRTSESTRVGDHIVCGYPGFTYDSSGTYVAVPGQTRIPRTARVPSYPAVEPDSLVCVWIGDAEPDPEAIPAHRGWSLPSSRRWRR